MKKFVFSLFFLFALTHGFAQKIQYSRQTFRTPLADAMQVVTDVGGRHHLLYFTAGKKPQLFVFDGMLQSFIKTEIDVRLKEGCDLHTVPFTTWYLLYLHVPGTGLHQLFKVQSDGEAEEVSYLLSNPADTAWNRSTATFQLFNQSNRLVLVAHTYYDAVKKISSRVVRFDSSLAMPQVSAVSFPYDKALEDLQQVSLAGNALLVLKTVKDEDKGNSLDVLKMGLSTGGMVSNSFNSGSHQYVNPVLYFNAVDSSVLLHSLVREPLNAGRFQRTVFIANLTQELCEKTPNALLKSLIPANTAASYLLVKGSNPRWLAMVNSFRVQRLGVRYSTPLTSAVNSPTAVAIGTSQEYRYGAGIEYNIPTAIRFTVFNDQFKKIKDSVVANSGTFYDVQPRPYGQFVIDKKACLLLIENFSIRQHGLVLFSGDANGGLSAVSIPVYDRNDYIIEQVQAVKNSFILPYTHKNETGLLKITLTD